METTDWSNTVYSPSVKGDTSPYYHDLDHAGATGGHGANGTPQNASQLTPNFSEQDQYLLHQIEHNLYEAASNGTPGSSGAQANGAQHPRGDGSGKYEFGLDNLNFVIPEDVSYEQLSTAYPPSASNLNTNTPHMLPHNIKKQAKEQESRTMFMSPVLPGQNEKSYNNQHYFHKFQKQSNEGNTYAHQPSNQHVRPEAVFTPLESPAVTPRENQVNSNNYPYNPPVQATFEPLTSPALNAQPDKRRTSSVYAPTEETVPHKRRTPHGTPILPANGPGRSKRSPTVKPRNSHKSLTSSPFEKLPEAGVDLQKNSGSSTPMLPPQGKKVEINNNGNEVPPSSTMMGFTMSVLAEQQQEGSNKSSKPGSVQGTPLNGPIRNSISSYPNGKILPKSSSSSETSPTLDLQKGSDSPVLSRTKSRSEKPIAKKASHKLAEQGRRNRMNMAVHELSSLIPQAYHDEVSIPSKATTIELASKYIRDLIKENNDMKYYNLER